MDVPNSLQPTVDWFRALGRNLYFWGGLAVLLALGVAGYLVVDGLIMPSYTRHDVSITVPNVEEQPFEEAEKQLQASDLQVERQVGRYNPNVEHGVVVDQTPLPNAKVKPGRRVYLTVNAGEAPTVQLPDLTGMSVREAKNRVSSLNLEVGGVQEDPIPSPYANTITKQDPEPGDSLEQGNTVSLWYSTGLGEETVETPNVVGRSVADARETLLAQQLRSVVVDPGSDDEESTDTGESSEEPPEDERFVLRQGHSPGTSVRAGTEIRLFTTTDQEEAAERRSSSSNSSDGTEENDGS